MTREEIKNTPELVDFMLDKCVLADSRTKVRKRLEEVCDLAIKALEQEPCTDAQERYEDLCEYFGDAKDILKSRKDFKAWLERIKWHIHKAEELAAENDDLRDKIAMRDRFQKQEPCEDACKKCLYAEETDGSHCYECVKGESKFEQEPCDDTALERQTEKICQYRDEDGYCWTDEKCKYQSNDELFCQKQDAASRQAVLDCATLITSIPTEDWDIGDWVCLFRDRVSQLPSVRPQPKTGHWIEKDNYLYVCSECGQYIYSETEHDLLEFHAFCGRCGAKMESEV